MTASLLEVVIIILETVPIIIKKNIDFSLYDIVDVKPSWSRCNRRALPELAQNDRFSKSR